MASLKEVKTRIGSVNSTRKITSAMKMIASSKLHRAQAAISRFLPYSQQLDSILRNLLSSDTGFDSAFAQQREVKRVAIVVLSSNSSLCGAFNTNVAKEFVNVYKGYESLGRENVLVYPLGKKIAEFVKKAGLNTQGNYQAMIDNPSYPPVADLANELITKFLTKEIDKIVIIYHHFISTSTQVIKTETYLPFNLEQVSDEPQPDSGILSDYILEPSREEILSALIPKVLISRLYAAILDSVASEHAARTIAMQIATDNAEELIEDLTIQYNKTRQQAITNELLDIIGGASALG